MANLLKKSVSMVATLSMLATSVPAFAATTTVVDGDLVKQPGSSAVYLVQGSTLRTFPYSTIYHSWGFPSNYSTVKTVDNLTAYSIGDPIPFRDGSCFRGTAKSLPGFESEAVFCVSNGQLRPVESQNAFFGLFNVTNWTQGNKYVQYIPDDFLSKFDFAFGEKVTESEINAGKLMDGLIVKGSVDGTYYLVQDGKLRALSAEAASANKFDLSKAVTVAQTKINAMPAALPVSTITETALVTPKTKAEAQSAGTVTEIAQAAKVIVSADKTTVDADGISSVNVTAKIVTANGALVSTANNNVVFAITNGSGTLSTSSINAVNGTATVKLTPSTVASNIIVTAYVNGLTSGSASIVAVANTQAPQVLSVSNQGMRIINVVFDRAVDKSTAQTTTNYIPKNNKGTSITVTSATLLSDNKTVQLFLNSGFYNDSNIDSIEIKNVQNAAQNTTMSSVTREFTMSDSSVPTVTGVEALGSKAIRVTFSEAVQGVDTAVSTIYSAFRLDDKTLSTGTGADSSTQLNNVTVTYPDAGDYTKALITFGNGISVGAHTLTVGTNSAISDYNVTTNGTTNAYSMQSAGYVATVNADTNVPALVSVEVLSQTTARYTFSKPVSVDHTSFFYSTSSNATSGVTPANNTYIKKISDTVYEATWSSAINTGNVYFYAGNLIKDYSGNNISPLPSNRLATVVSDTAPAISSVAMETESDTDVVINFNKDVDVTTATTASNYIFRATNGTALNSTTGGSSIGSNGNPVGSITRDTNNNKKVTIALNSAIPGGTYQLCVKNVRALSNSSSSAMNEQCSTFSVSDKTRPTITSVSAADAGTNYAGRIIIKFSEAMGPSALNAQNYRITGIGSYAADTKLSEVSGVTLSFRNSNKDVVIDFANSDEIVNNTSKITIGYISGSATFVPADVAGNLLSDGTTAAGLTDTRTISGLVTTGMDISTHISKAEIKSSTTVEVTFANELESISASEFTIRSVAATEAFIPTSAVICNAENYANKASTGCESEDAKKVIFTIPSGSSYEFTAADEQVIVATQTNELSSTKDTFGMLVINGKSITATGSSTFKNGIKPILKSVAQKGNNKVVLSFNGNIASADAADFVVTQNGKNFSVSSTSENGRNVELTLNTTSESLTNDPIVVKTVAQDLIRSTGSNGANIAADTTGKTGSIFVVTEITVASDVITVSFNRNLNFNDIVSGLTNDITPAHIDVSNPKKLIIDNFGEFESTSDFTIADLANAKLEYSEADWKVTITPKKADATTSTTISAGIASTDKVIFTPSSSLKTTTGIMIDSNFIVNK